MRPAPARAAWITLAILTFVNLFNYIDRLVVPAVGESIKHSSLHTTDAQFGALASVFLIVYMLTAPLFGALGDRPGRPRLIAAGIAIWSLATAAAGLANTYGQLRLARATVGIGEAAYAALAPAILADAFPERIRGRVFAIFYAAIPIGSALGYILGGLADRHYGWRAAFFIAGVPGLALAAATAFLPDPPIGGSDPEAATTRRTLGFRSYLPLLANARYLRTIAGYAAYTFALGGIAVWMPTFLIRVRGVPAATANTQLGAVLVVTGFTGTFIGGWLADALRGRLRQPELWVSGIATLLGAPLAYLALTVADARTYWIALVLAEVLLFVSTGPINAAIVSEVPAPARAAAMAGSILAIHLLGDVPSPWIIGAISDKSSLAAAVLIIPFAIVLAGAVWTAAAWRGERTTGATAQPRLQSP
jgi:MFS transporter, Spinster family, sphingosine-1-phosphate transporter